MEYSSLQQIQSQPVTDDLSLGMSDTTPARRYVIAASNSALVSSGEYRSDMRKVYSTLSSMNVSFISEKPGSDDKVAFLTEGQAHAIRSIGGIIVEQDLQYHLLQPLKYEPFDLSHLLVQTTDPSLAIETVDEATGQPVPFVKVNLFTDWDSRLGYQTVTDEHGKATVMIDGQLREFAAVVAYPKMNFWTRVTKNEPISATLSIQLRRLTVSNSERWGIELTRTANGTGKGVRVGVIDSGISHSHPNLHPSGGRNFVSSDQNNEWWNDERGHGTHVAGIIGAATTNTGGIDGYAPNAEILSYRVFGGPDGDGYTSTINKAITQAIDDQCDIINMSFGGPERGSTRTKIEAAVENGILCVAAVGNSSSQPVEAPALYDEVLAVSALGRFGEYPLDSVHHLQESSRVATSDTSLYSAAFTNYGDKVDLAAPGVAILSTIPPDGFVCDDGTSMACPHIVGLTAALLSDNLGILNMPRDGNRTQAIKTLILQLAKDVGLPVEYQGKGLPRVP